jgi:hypothetical protein
LVDRQPGCVASRRCPFVRAAARVDNAQVRKRLIHRMLGAPPAAGASRAERLRWIRKCYWWNLVAIAVVVIFALWGRSTFLWIVSMVVAAASIAGFASLSMKIHREESRGR